MAGLEVALKITAKDETGGAFAAVKAQLAALDKQIATVDKLMAAASKVASANDPMIASIAASSKALTEQRAAVASLGEGLAGLGATTSDAAGGQARLAGAIARTTEVMVVQGAEAGRIAGQIATAQRRQVASAQSAAKGFKHAVSEALPFAGPGLLAGTKKAVEEGGALSAMKFRVRELSRTDKTESPFAEGLAAEIAAAYPAITQAEALHTYIELRGNAGKSDGTIDQALARANLMTVSRAQTAALALGTEITPEDAQNLLKSVEGSGRAGDPTAIGKMFDAYLKAKQVFGTAIDSSKIRDYVQNAKGANFGIGEEQFFWQNLVRMTEGNASRLGNETAQTLQTLVGGHATKQTAKWLVAMGLASGFTAQGGGAATIKGLSGSDVLQVNQLEWANRYLLPALEKHGVLSEENLKKREELLKKDNPDISGPALRERAEAGLIAAAIAQSGMRTTVTDNLAHAIANELLIARDTAQMKGAVGIGAAADIAQNPAAALSELTASIANFAAVLTSPAMPAAASAMSGLANVMATFGKQYSDFSKDHPDIAATLSAGGVGAGGATGGWLTWKLFTGLGRLFGLGGDAAAGASAGVSAEGVSSLGWLADAGLAGALGTGAEIASGLMLLHQIGEAANPTTAAGAPYRLDKGWASQTWDFERASRAEREFRADPEAARGRAMMALGASGAAGQVTANVTGQVTNETTIRVDPGSELLRVVDAVRRLVSTATLQQTAPAATGRMDSDAAPQRGGIGHM